MMIRLLLVCVSVVFGSCASVSNDIEYATVAYDNGKFMRVVSPWSNDLARWSENPEQNGLDVLTIRDKDSLRIYRNLLKTMIVDSTAQIIPTVSAMQLEEGDFVGLHYTDNDIHADAMIVFYYEDSAKSNDSLFISSTCMDQIRYNGFRATADSLCWAAVANQIAEFRQK